MVENYIKTKIDRINKDKKRKAKNVFSAEIEIMFKKHIAVTGKGIKSNLELNGDFPHNIIPLK